ncbi:MAG: pilus assembly protein CpaF [Mycobacteriales bacterium]
MTAEVVERVRRRLAQEGGMPSRAELAALVRAESGGLAAERELLDLVREAEAELAGAGPLESLLRQPGTTDVLVNGPDQVWLDRGNGLERVGLRFSDDTAVRLLAQRLAAAAGHRLDDGRPWVDATLPDGTRLHAVLAPVAADGTCLSLRCFRPRGFTLRQLQGTGTLTEESAELVAAIVRARLAFLVTGGTGSGKTTLLGTMLGLIERAERLVIVEDSAELRPDHQHVVRLTTRTANVEGAGVVTLRDLVRQALRMRPDRLVVGEVRGAEVVEMLTALNTGHDGGAGTVHANSATELPARLEALAGLAGLGRHALHSQLAAAVQVALHLRRGTGGRRELAEIGVLRRVHELVAVFPAWRRDTGPAAAWDDLCALLQAGAGGR